MKSAEDRARQRVQWLGAEVPLAYGASLDRLLAQSFGGYGLADFPRAERRYVLIDGKEVLAHGAVQGRVFNLDGRAWRGFVVGAVCTDPGFRLQGLGSQLMEFLLAQLSTEEGDFAVLNCGEPVVPFYQQLGFHQVAPRARYSRNGVEEIDDDPVLAFSFKQGCSLGVLTTEVFPLIDDF